MRLGIVGGGRAAWAFGSVWKRRGSPLAGISLRDESTSRVPELLETSRLTLGELVAESDLIFLAVSDSALPQLAERMEEHSSQTTLFHASGALTSALFSAGRDGFSLHPLRALSTIGTEISFEHTVLVYEGSDERLPLVTEVASRLNGQLVRIDAAQKSAYHAGAVFGSNYVALLLAVSEILLRESGLVQPDVKSWIAELARSAITNWETASGDAQFTGPVARGDQALINQHLEALAGQPNLLALYRTLGQTLHGMLSGSADPRSTNPFNSAQDTDSIS